MSRGHKNPEQKVGSIKRHALNVVSPELLALGLEHPSQSVPDNLALPHTPDSVPGFSTDKLGYTAGWLS